MHIRGLAVDGQEVTRRWAFGVLPLRLLLIAGYLTALYTRGMDLVQELFWVLFWWLLPVFVVLLFLGWLGSRTRSLGCLAALVGLGWGAGRGAGQALQRRNGWNLTIDDGSGEERLELAGNLQVSADQEVLAYGPRVAGVRRAWFIQVLSDPTDTCLGRGVVGVVVLALVLLPQIVWLLLR